MCSCVCFEAQRKAELSGAKQSSGLSELHNSRPTYGGDQPPGHNWFIAKSKKKKRLEKKNKIRKIRNDDVKVEQRIDRDRKKERLFLFSIVFNQLCRIQKRLQQCQREESIQKQQNKAGEKR